MLLLLLGTGHDKTIRSQQQRSDFQHTLKRADSVRMQITKTAQSSCREKWCCIYLYIAGDAEGIHSDV